MMTLIEKPIIIPPDMTLRRAAGQLRAKAEDMALERCALSNLPQMAHERVAAALDKLANDCLSTSQLPESPEALKLWASGDYPRAEVKNVGCLVPPRFR